MGEIVIEEPLYFLMDEAGEVLKMRASDGRLAVQAFTSSIRAWEFINDPVNQTKDCQPQQHNCYAESERFFSNLSNIVEDVCVDGQTQSTRMPISFVIKILAHYRQAINKKDETARNGEN